MPRRRGWVCVCWLVRNVGRASGSASHQMMGRWGGDSPWKAKSSFREAGAPVPPKRARLQHLSSAAWGRTVGGDMERENPSREAVLITGGSGYFGFR
ncbi:hypothetical protein E2320_001252, partial [Naja naja]